MRCSFFFFFFCDILELTGMGTDVSFETDALGKAFRAHGAHVLLPTSTNSFQLLTCSALRIGVLEVIVISFRLPFIYESLFLSA